MTAGKHSKPAESAIKPKPYGTPRRKGSATNVAYAIIIMLLGVITVCVLEINRILQPDFVTDIYATQFTQTQTANPTSKSKATTEEDDEADTKEASNDRSQAQVKNTPVTTETQPEETALTKAGTTGRQKVKQEQEKKPEPKKTPTYSKALIIGSANLSQYSDAIAKHFAGATIITRPDMSTAEVIAELQNHPGFSCIVIQSGDCEPNGVWNTEVRELANTYPEVPIYMMTINYDIPQAELTNGSIHNIEPELPWLHALEFADTDQSEQSMLETLEKILPKDE